MSRKAIAVAIAFAFSAVAQAQTSKSRAASKSRAPAASTSKSRAPASRSRAVSRSGAPASRKASSGKFRVQVRRSGYNQGQHNRGQYNLGQYNSGQYNRGQRNRGQRNRGQYSRDRDHGIRRGSNHQHQYRKWVPPAYGYREVEVWAPPVYRTTHDGCHHARIRIGASGFRIQIGGCEGCHEIRTVRFVVREGYWRTRSHCTCGHARVIFRKGFQ